jgi:RNA polymerase sigma factor (TIGR02999 family)
MSDSKSVEFCAEFSANALTSPNHYNSVIFKSAFSSPRRSDLPVKPPSEIITIVDLRNLLGELRAVARRLLASESGPQSLTPTALAITALRRAKLSEQDWEDVRWENRSHFFGCLALAMRHALIDRARRPHTKLKTKTVPWDDAVLLNLPGEAEERPDRYIELDEALATLQKSEPDLAKAIHQFYFAGYAIQEMAAFAEVSEKTIDRDLKKARVVLKRLMTRESACHG